MPLSAVGTAEGGRETPGAGPTIPAPTVRRRSTVSPRATRPGARGRSPSRFAGSSQRRCSQRLRQQTLRFTLSH
jgi:hypothetical protein